MTFESPRFPLRDRLRRALTSPRAPWLGLALALVLLAPTLGDGLRMDDRWLRAMSLGDPRFPPLQRAAHRLFTFYDGPETLAQLRAEAVNPWFADDGVRLTFFRPLSSLLHYAEFQLLGRATWVMHAVSLALYAALVVAALRFLTRLLGREGGVEATGTAGFATALYALDAHHGIAVGWLAQRNSILAALFGVLSVHAHDRAVRDAHRPSRWLAPGFALLSLWSAEAGVATLFVLVAHALTLTPRHERLRSLVSCLAPLFVWGLGYATGGYGVRGSGMYLDLVGDPFHAVANALRHWPVLVSLELGNQVADLWVLGTPTFRTGVFAFGLVLVLGFGLIVAPLLRREPSSRFLALATVLSLVPPCGALPAGRLVLFSGVFLLPLIARALLDWLDGTLAPWRPVRPLCYALLAVLAVYRVLLSPPLLASGARSMVVFENAFGAFSASLPDDPGRERVAFVVNAPDLGFFGYIPLLARELGRTPPRVYPLANGNRPVTLRKLDADSFSVRCEGGFARSATDQLARSEATPWRIGEAFVSGPLTFKVTHLDAEGRADEARVDSTMALDDPRLSWLAWDGPRLVPIDPPRGPEPLVFPAQRFLDHLLQSTSAPIVRVPGG